jgi:hypothetical protein
MHRFLLILILTASFLTLATGQTQPAVSSAAPAPNQTAQVSTSPLKLGPFSVSGSWRVRMEAYDWFEAPPLNNDYAFAHSILRVNLGLQRRSWESNLEVAQPSLLGAPNDAVAPGAQGPLGLGGNYFVANGASRNAAFVFPSKLYLRFKGFGGEKDNRLTIGRFEFIEGMEPGTKDKTLTALKTMRIAHRLIGNFAFSMTGRSEDGVHLSLSTPGQSNFTFAAARPTRGVFQVDGLGELDVAWEYGAFTKSFIAGKSAGELRVFGLGYQDVRAVTKTDNRTAAIRSGADRFENINIGSFGAHYLHVLNSKSAGKWDFLLWGVGQTGQWGLQSHRAGAGAVEVGWQPVSSGLKPWLRVGYNLGSGDGNSTDNRHNTFFQVLPTPRWYARYPLYDMQNMQDVSATVILRPGTKWNIRSEFHNLALASRKDLWYQGGGAFQPRTFGYTGRTANNHRGFAHLWDASVDYQLTSRLTIGGYFANAWGQSVIRSIYPAGDMSRFGYTEFTYKF